MAQRRNFLAASVPGPSHLRKGIVCQDAFEIGNAGEAGEILVAAVADGLGSASLSDIGSKLATGIALRSLLDAVASHSIENASIDELLLSAFHQAREGLKVEAEALNCAIRDLATTLMLGCWHGTEFHGIHIGDGAIVLALEKNYEENYHLYSVEEDQEYANEVYPLTAEDWEKHVRVPGPITGVTGFAMFTDGCQRAALIKRDGHYTPFSGFLNPLFQYARELENSEVPSETLARLLQSPKLTSNSDDDKTLVIAVETAE